MNEDNNAQGEKQTLENVEHSESWQVRATICEFMAFSFAYPTKDLIEVLVSGEYADAFKEISQAAGIATDTNDIAALGTYSSQDPEDALRILRTEATRLFVGAPEPVVSPYEGVWRAEDDGVQALLFVNPHSMAVERFMKNCGITQVEGKNEPFDHIATELAFMEFLASAEAGIIKTYPQIDAPEEGWAAIYERFLEEHPKTWMSHFADAVITEAREPFYRVAAQLLKEAIEQ